jgi:hypothetical protein
MKHIKLFEQFVNEGKLTKKSPGYLEGLETVKTKEALENFFLKNKKKMESLPMEELSTQSDYYDLASIILPKLVNNLNRKLKNISAYLTSKRSFEVISSEVNTNQHYDTVFPSIEIFYVGWLITVKVGSVQPNDSWDWDKSSKDIKIEPQNEKHQDQNLWTSNRERVYLKSNANAIIDFLISSSTFSRLLQNHVNACTAYIKAVNAHEITDKDKLKKEAEKVISDFAWEVSTQIEDANKYNRRFKSSNFSQEKMEKYFKSMTKGWTSEEIISDLRNWDWRGFTMELGLPN